MNIIAKSSQMNNARSSKTIGAMVLSVPTVTSDGQTGGQSNVCTFMSNINGTSIIKYTCTLNHLCRQRTRPALLTARQGLQQWTPYFQPPGCDERRGICKVVCQR